jgi:hypothetical protein
MHGRKERKKKLNAMRCGRVIIRPVRKTIAVSSLITMSVLAVPAASGTHGNSHLSLRAPNKNMHTCIYRIASRIWYPVSSHEIPSSHSSVTSESADRECGGYVETKSKQGGLI